MNRFSLMLVAGVCLLASCAPSPSGPEEDGTAESPASRVMDFLFAGPDGGMDADGGTVTDGGTVVTDGGTVVTDGGTVVTDGGTVVTDGGTVVTDGGMDADGGTVVADGGTDGGPVIVAELTLSPLFLDFGPQPTCTTSTVQSVTLTSTLAQPRQIVAAAASGSFELKSIKDQAGAECTLPCTLEPDSQQEPRSLSFEVEFHPSTPGGMTGSLVLFTNDANQPSFTVPLRGNGRGPLLTLSTPSVSFGPRNLGSTTSYTLHVSNTGNEPFNGIPSATAPFSVPASISIPANTFAPLQVSFAPTARGSFAGNLILTSTSSCPPPPAVQLSGMGKIPAQLWVSHPTLSFAEQPVNTASTPQTVTVRNEGDELLSVTSLAINSTHFSVTPNGAFSLVPGQDKQLLVTFRPTTVGDKSAQLTLNSNDPASPALPVTLTGTVGSGNPCFSFDPSSHSFPTHNAGAPPGAPLLVRVRNTGNVSLALSPAVDHAAFQVNPSTPFTLAPGAPARELQVSFAPRATDSGAIQGKLTLTSTPASQCQTDISLSGVARKTFLTLDRPTITFPDHVLGDPAPKDQVLLINRSEWPVTVYPIPAGATVPYSVSGIPAAGLTLNPQDRVLLTITFDPSTWGNAFDRSVQLLSDATDAAPVLELHGKSLAPELTPASATVNFGAQPPGMEAIQSLVMTNQGNMALNLTDAIPDNPAHFRIKDFAPQTVEPAGTITLKAAFNPSMTGDLATQIKLYSGTRLLPNTILLKGRANGPIPVFPLDPIDFSYQQTGQSRSLEVPIRNSIQADETLTLVSASIVASPSTFSVDTIPPSEPPIVIGGTRNPPLKVHFNPGVAGTKYQDKLRIVYKGSSSATTFTRLLDLRGEGADAELTPDSRTLNFPATLPNGSSRLSVTIENTGNVPVDLLSVIPTPDTYFKASVDKWPDTIIPAQGKRRIDVTFIPTSTGFVSSELDIRLKKSPNTSFLKIALSGIGAFPKAELSPTVLPFGEVPRATFDTRQLTIRNTGTATLTVSNVPSDGPFTVKPTQGPWPVIIAAGDSETLDITFNPTTTTPAQVTLHIFSDSQGAPDIPLTVSGKGIVPIVALPGGSALLFDDQPQNTPSNPREVVIKNEGPALLKVESVEAPGDFCLSSTNDKLDSVCPSSLPDFQVLPGMTHSFYVTAWPSIIGDLSKALIITSNAEPSVNSIELKVKGVGGISVASTTVEFGSCNLGASTEAAVLIRNTSETDAQVSIDFDASSPWRSEFSATPMQLTVPKQSSLEFPLRFKPSGTVVGRREISAILTQLGSSTTHTLTLQALATSAQLAVERADGEPFDYTLDFGGVRVNRQSGQITLNLTNIGGALTVDAGTPAGDAGLPVGPGRLTIRNIAIKGGDSQFFSLDNTALPRSLEPGQSVAIALRFSPTAQRNFAASLEITSDASLRTDLKIPLTGRGVSNQLSFSVLNIDFQAQVAESTASVVKPLRITNEGIEPIRLTGVELAGVAEHSEPSHFSVEKVPALPYTLEPRQFLEVDVRFVPRPDVTSRAALEITSSDVESPVAKVTLAGRGLSTVFRALSRTVDFGTLRQSEPALTKLTLTNDSSLPIVLKPPKLEGPQAYNFSVVSPTIDQSGRTLAPGASLTLELRFNTTEASSSRATLVLDTQDQERAALVTILGKAVPSFLAIDPMTVDFGWVDIGVRSAPEPITLINQSSSATRVSILENTNPAFEVDDSELNRELAPGEQATLQVTFLPSQGGDFTGDLKLRLQGESAADVSIALAGRARTLEGEGGCACGTGGGGSALLGLLLLAVLRARRRSTAR